MSVDATPDSASRCRALRRLEARGSQGVLAQVVDTFMSETSAQVSALRKAAIAGEIESVFRIAHSLQGSAAMVGAVSVARVCGELVRAARIRSVDQFESMVTQVEAGFEAIRGCLIEWSDRVQPADPIAPSRPRPGQIASESMHRW